MMRLVRRATEQMPARAFLCACSDDELRWILGKAARNQSRKAASRCLSCRRGEVPQCVYAGNDRRVRMPARLEPPFTG